MKINTQVQLLVTFFKELLLRVKSNTPGSTTVFKLSKSAFHHHLITATILAECRQFVVLLWEADEVFH
ncbi:hypothetical protein MNBD_GAMMA02-217 [hydrothermal vent metagenome]|uniref:Uncharacterized protein n=1 Tax=hydrothermal vent metagenome TaxID=652676 RepID=A0A3B0VQU4_9ZZZZ